jgi:DNA polymerase-3 subunit beta
MTTASTTTPVATKARARSRAPHAADTGATATPDTLAAVSPPAALTVSCLQENLKRGLTLVNHAVAGKSTLPILSHVLLATNHDQLKLIGTNLDLAITTWLGARVAGEGAIALPAKLLADVVSDLPNERIDLALDPQSLTVNLRCERFEANIKGLEAEQFPTIPTISDADVDVRRATFRSAALRAAIQHVAFAAASDDSRPVLAGVLLEIRTGLATLVAADGVRLALATIDDLPELVTEPWSAIVPASALAHLARVMSDANEPVAVTMAPSGGQVVFHTESLDLITRVIDGRYPDYARIIPQQCQTRVVLDRREFGRAISLASTIATASANILRLTLTPGLPTGTVTLRANAAEVGDNSIVLDGALEGVGGLIALNVKLLAAAVSAVDTPQIALEIQTPTSPAVLKPVGADGSIHIMMPMTV